MAGASASPQGPVQNPPPATTDRSASRRPNRRQLLIGGAAAAAGGAAAAALLRDRDGADYPRVKVARAADLEPNVPVQFDYPLQGQRSVLLDLGEEVPGGVGDGGRLVAYSIRCQHMGCPLGWLAERRQLRCACHQSIYDPARSGSVVQGVAQRALPRIALAVEDGDVYAVGVEGLIYGYRDNLAPGTRVH